MYSTVQYCIYIYGALWGPRVPIYGALWGPRVPGLMDPGLRDPGPRVPGLRDPGPRVPGLRDPGPGAQGGLRDPGPGTQLVSLEIPGSSHSRFPRFQPFFS